MITACFIAISLAAPVETTLTSSAAEDVYALAGTMQSDASRCLLLNGSRVVWPKNRGNVRALATASISGALTTGANPVEVTIHLRKYAPGVGYSTVASYPLAIPASGTFARSIVAMVNLSGGEGLELFMSRSDGDDPSGVTLGEVHWLVQVQGLVNEP